MNLPQKILCPTIKLYKFKSQNLCTMKSPTESTKWKPIYQLPSIKFLAALSKLKLYQGMGTAILIPIVMGLESHQFVGSGLTELSTTIGITGTISLSLYSAFSKNLIGFIYISADDQRIRFGHIDFWGRRKNSDINIDDFDIQSSGKRLGIYLPIRSDQGTFKLLPQLGKILDSQRFSYLFGEC